MSNNRGVTMVEMVIVIVIIIILAVIAYTAGRESIDEANITEVYSEFKSVREAVASVQTQMNFDDTMTLTQGVQYDVELSSEQKTAQGLDTEAMYYLIYGSMNEENYSRSTVEGLGLSSLKRDYIVNYQTGEVLLEDAIIVNGSTVRTYEDLKEIMWGDAYEK